MFSLNGNVFSGRSTLGVGSVGGLRGFLDDLLEDDPGDTPPQSPGALPNFGGDPCPEGTKPDPVNPKQFCVPTTEAYQTMSGCKSGEYYDYVSMKCVKNTELGPSGQSPFTNPCPAGQTTYNGKCVPVKTCPAGTNYDLATQQCSRGVYVFQPGATPPPSTGSGTSSPPKPAPVTQTAPPPPAPAQSGISPMAIAAVALGVGALGAIIYKVRKDKKANGGMSPNEYGEEGYLDVQPGRHRVFRKELARHRVRWRPLG